MGCASLLRYKVVTRSKLVRHFYNNLRVEGDLENDDATMGLRITNKVRGIDNSFHVLQLDGLRDIPTAGEYVCTSGDVDIAESAQWIHWDVFYRPCHTSTVRSSSITFSLETYHASCLKIRGFIMQLNAPQLLIVVRNCIVSLGRMKGLQYTVAVGVDQRKKQ
ncbi:hypothetical protein NE237_006392 [Protea cynaroides]|uniref:Uncharacterized protein n=1 Tax=Protea cynaroides TaxID=273540 RepID=A0A9Q0KM75_9MAGN|nr:hypothetical protein NE237_006392 [Protea cynaroides]